MASETSKRLEQLARIDKDELCRQVVAELLGVSGDATYARFRNRGLDFHRKKDIAKVLREFKPEIDRWSRARTVAEETGIDDNVVIYWSRTPQVKKQIGVRKAGHYCYFNPVWVKKVTKQLKTAGGWNNLISSRQAATLLGVNIGDLSSYRLSVYQFAGHRTKTFYAHDQVRRLKARIDREGGLENLTTGSMAALLLDVGKDRLPSLGLTPIQLGGKRSRRYFRLDKVREFKAEVEKAEALRTTRQIAFELDWPDRQVLRIMDPTMIHPISGEPRYRADVIGPYVNGLRSKATLLTDILEYCQAHIYPDDSVTKSVKGLVYRKHIPIAGKDDLGQIYLGSEGEAMIRTIYRNFRQMREMEISLVSIADASEQLPISEKQLRHLIEFYGTPEPLTSGCPSTHLGAANGSRPSIPYVVYVPGCRVYRLTSPIVSSLHVGIRSLQAKLEAEGKKLSDIQWRSEVLRVTPSGQQ